MYYTGCIDASISPRVLLLGTVSRLLGGEGPQLLDGPCCPAVALVTTTVCFVVNVFGVGLVINKFTQPKTKLLVSRTAVLKQRDGAFVLQARYLSAYGHALTNATAKISSYVHRCVAICPCSLYPVQSLLTLLYLSRKTEEGEGFVEIKLLHAETPYRGGVFPMNVSHEINVQSPLFGLLPEAFAFEVFISAFDEVLGEVVNASQVYEGGAGDVKVAYEFDDCFLVSAATAMADSSKKVVIDAARLSAVKPLGADLLEKLKRDMAVANGWNDEPAESSASTLLRSSVAAQGPDDMHYHSANLPNDMKVISRGPSFRNRRQASQSTDLNYDPEHHARLLSERGDPDIDLRSCSSAATSQANLGAKKRSRFHIFGRKKTM